MFLIVLIVVLVAASEGYSPRFRQMESSSDLNDKIRETVRKDLISQCDELFRDTALDHFTFVSLNPV